MIEWRPVQGYEGLYEVSNDGQVKSLERRIHYTLPSGKESSRLCREKVLKQYTGDRYAKVALYDENGGTTTNVHRLVAEAFCDNAEGKPEVNHINGDKLDNRAENLEWVTAQENYEHAMLNGLVDRLKLTEHDVRTIKKEGRRGNQKVLAAMYGVTLHQINGIVNGRFWKAIA